MLYKRVGISQIFSTHDTNWFWSTSWAAPQALGVLSTVQCCVSEEVKALLLRENENLN